MLKTKTKIKDRGLKMFLVKEINGLDHVIKVELHSMENKAMMLNSIRLII